MVVPKEIQKIIISFVLTVFFCMPLSVDASWSITSNPWVAKIKATLSRMKINTSNVSATISGAVGAWSFNGPDMVGGTVYDRSGQGNNLYFVDLATSTAYVPGKIGQGLYFSSGVVDYLESSSDITTYDFGTGDFSVSLWFKTTFAGVGTRMISTRAICGHDVYWEVNISASNFNTCVDGGSLELLTCATGATVINDDEWHHGVFTRAGTEIKNYIDGVLDSSATADTVVDLNNNAPLRIGDSICANDYHGYLDEVSVYNRRLSVNEIKRLYNMGR